MQNAWGHFLTITKHKWIVMKLCFRCGLYKQGLLHDVSKYSWVEFRAGVHYFQGNRSPNSIERTQFGYSPAWLHHKGRNKHHWEYWIELIEIAIPIQMPVCYVIEMFCDRVAATKVYQKGAYDNASALAYFLKNYDNVIMEEHSKALTQLLLEYLAANGLDETIRFINKEVKKKGYALVDRA